LKPDGETGTTTLLVGEITARLRRETSFVNFDRPIETDEEKRRRGRETLKDTDPKSSENTERKTVFRSILPLAPFTARTAASRFFRISPLY